MTNGEKLSRKSTWFGFGFAGITAFLLWVDGGGILGFPGFLLSAATAAFSLVFFAISFERWAEREAR